MDHFAEKLLAGMTDAVIYADAAGVIRRWNQGATRIFGFTEADACGQSLDIIIPANEPARAALARLPFHHADRQEPLW